LGRYSGAMKLYPNESILLLVMLFMRRFEI